MTSPARLAAEILALRAVLRDVEARLATVPSPLHKGVGGARIAIEDALRVTERCDVSSVLRDAAQSASLAEDVGAVEDVWRALRERSIA